MERLLAERYQLETVIGAGGMGTVWRAHDMLLDRQVAIKEVRYPAHLTDGEQQELTTRAVAEARHAARLEHARIVPIYDVLIHESRPWIVMRFIAGLSLEQHVLATGRLAPAEVRRLGIGLLQALAAAHRGGVIHRDVKPSNVLIGDDGEPMLTDFSIARAIGKGTATNTGLVVGSPGYIAPERVIMGTAGPEADLFGLGATLFFAAEGRAPFAHEDAMAGAFAAAIHPHPRPIHAGPTLTLLLDGLLEKDPRQRLTIPAAANLLGTPAPPTTPAPTPPPSSPFSPTPTPPATPSSPFAPASTSPAAPPSPFAPASTPPATPPPPFSPTPTPSAAHPSPFAPTTPPGSQTAPPGSQTAPPGSQTAPPGSQTAATSPFNPEPAPPLASALSAGPTPTASAFSAGATPTPVASAFSVAATPSLPIEPALFGPASAVKPGVFAPGWAEVPAHSRPDQAEAPGGLDQVGPSGPRRWISGRLALIAATVLVLSGAGAVIAQVVDKPSKSGALPASPQPSVTLSPSSVPSPTPAEASPSASVQSKKPAAPRTTGPAASPFFSPELKVFGAGWESGMSCTSHHASPARAIDASSCGLSSAPIPDLTKAASRRVTVFLELYPPGGADDNMGCTPTYPISGMASTKVDRPGTTGNRAGFYCESTGTFTSDGNLIGACTYIMWTSGDNTMMGMLSNCFRFSDEGASFRPTIGMLTYLRSLWNARA